MEERIVLPGEKIAEGRHNIPNGYFNGSHTVATVIGMGDEGRYIPLVSQYHPKVGDMVIGLITDVRHAGYSVDLNLPTQGFISTRNVRIKLEYGDFVVCKIREATETGDVELSEIRRLPIGKVVDFPPAKIPRLIGRKSSMIDMLKDHTKGDILVGNNGYVWISDKCDIPLLLEAMKMVEEKAHTSGLTDKVKDFLDSNISNNSNR